MSEHADDEDALLRRVADKPDLLKRTDGGMFRLTSVAFKLHSADGGISVELRRLLPDPTAPLSVLDEFPSHGLAELFAGAVRRIGLNVMPDPLPSSAAHANIVGLLGLPKPEAKRKQRELADLSAWIRMPASALAEPGA